MALTPGTRLGSYEIRSLLGVGGMGEVYRAVDTKLGREVALKLLPEAVSSDPARRARFDREAQTLAALNHPHIAQIFGLEDNALVMELLEGVTLTDRLAAGPLPIRKAIDYGVQLARGLAAAHDRGIVHRDLKPDNVFVLKDGHVKIIDFGLARGSERPPSDDSLTAMTARVHTDPGTVMGTVGYMAPEQVRGETIDARTDLFALGTVLYEMLTGQRAFKRDTAAETMTAILREDPAEMSALRPDVPPALVRIVSHCLEKNPVERFQTARDIAFALDSLSSPGSGSSVSTIDAAPPARGVRGERLLWIGISAALAAVAIWALLTRDSGTTRTAVADEEVYRSVVLLPEGIRLSQGDQAPLRLGIAPDGRHIAFVGATVGSGTSIWDHSLITGESRRLPGTEEGIAPVWSRDGKRLLFSVNNQAKLLDEQLRVTTLEGVSYGWFGDEAPYLAMAGAPGQWTLGVVRQPGGRFEKLHEPGPGENFLLPRWVPGTRLFVVQHRKAAGEAGRRVEMGSIDGGPLTPLAVEATTPHVAAGHLVFAQGDQLFAQPLDLERRQVTGEPTLLAEHVDTSPTTGAAFSASDRVIAYAEVQSTNVGLLTVVDRGGRTVSTVGEADSYSNIELSPDGRRIALSITDTAQNARDIYIVDLARGVKQRLTTDPSEERAAIWTPDGRSIIYNSKGLDFYSRPSDFGGSETRVLANGISKDPGNVSPDGTRLLYRLSNRGTTQ